MFENSPQLSLISQAATHARKQPVQLAAVGRAPFGSMAQIVPLESIKRLPAHHACMSTVVRGGATTSVVTPTPLPSLKRSINF